MRSRAIAAVTALVMLASETDARAGAAGDAIGGVVDGIVTVTLIVGGILIVDVGFVTYDTVLAAKSDRPSKVYGIVEGSWGGLQSALGLVAMGIGASSEHDSSTFTIITPLLTIPSFMSVHGVWGAASPNVDPGALYGVSWATGADAVLTSAAVGAATSGRLGGRSHGILAMIATAPQIAVSTAEIANGAREKPGWIALDAWAGVLFAHGLVSAIVGDDVPEPPPVELPPPPPPSPIAPDPPTPSGPLAPDTKRDVHFAPIAIAGGGGLMIQGAW